MRANTFAVVALSACLSGVLACGDLEKHVKEEREAYEKSLREERANAINGVSYFQDARTGLCFAHITSHSERGYSITSISHVPCADKVLALIKEIPR